MFSPLKAAFALLYLAELISSRPLTTTSSTASRLKLSEITHRIQQLNTGVQVPCNDTRVAQVAFTDRKLSEHDLLCQAATALAKVTRCKNDYEPLIINLKSLHGKATGHRHGAPVQSLHGCFREPELPQAPEGHLPQLAAHRDKEHQPQGTVSRGSRQHYLPAGVPTGPPQNPPT
uniref:Interleukin 4 n=1 Tax=Anas platyrhynchos TaxID=8839 RepID=A0A8B9SMD6_ANAPL